MSSPDPSTTESPPLSADALAVIGRARRSFLFSIGLLLLGFIAIGAALVYRSGRDQPAPDPGTYAQASLRLPAGALATSAVAADGTVTVTYQLAGASFIRVFDGDTGELAGEYSIVLE